MIDTAPDASLLEIPGRVFNIQRFSTHDGPGVRTTVFLKGCPLRCFWCQNPESQSPEPALMYRQDSCTRCGRCVRVCPNHANRIENGELIIDRSRCTACGACVIPCLAKARSISGKTMRVGEVLHEVLKDRMLYQNSGGGMTVSGGACEMQPEFTAALMQAAHAEGIHTAAEMEGAFPWPVIERIVRHTDYILYDLKCIDEAQHLRGTKISNAHILENARRLVQTGKPIRFRTPLIPGFNDDPETVEAIAHFVRDQLHLSPAAHLELLPYNNLGEDKYRRLGFTGEAPCLERQSEEYLKALNARVAAI